MSHGKFKTFMATYQQDSFLSEILEGKKIPFGKLAYFRERFRNRLYDLVISVFLNQEKTKKLTRADVARRIQRRPEQVTRWLGAPGNWTIDTVSDLILAMGGEPNVSFSVLGEKEGEVLITESDGQNLRVSWDMTTKKRQRRGKHH